MMTFTADDRVLFSDGDGWDEGKGKFIRLLSSFSALFTQC